MSRVENYWVDKSNPPWTTSFKRTPPKSVLSTIEPPRDFLHGQNQAVGRRDFLGLKSPRKTPLFPPGLIDSRQTWGRRKRPGESCTNIPPVHFPLPAYFSHPIFGDIKISSPHLPHETGKTKFHPFLRKHRLRHHLMTNFILLRVYFSSVIHPRESLLLLQQQAKRRHHTRPKLKSNPLRLIHRMLLPDMCISFQQKSAPVAMPHPFRHRWNVHP